MLIHKINEIPIGLELKILIITIFIMLLIATGLALYIKENKTTKNIIKLPKIIGYLTIIPIIFLGIISMNLVNANSKGLQYTNWAKLSMNEIKNIASVTPKASELPDNLKGSIVILYKFGCPSCEAIYKDLNEKIKDKNRVYFVPSGSKEGKILVKNGNITEVPTGVYVRQKSLANGAKQNNILLYNEDRNGKPLLNEKGLDRLFLLQKQGK